MEKQTYTIDDLMALLDLSRSTVYVLVHKNLFRSVKVGKQIRIPRKSFDSWFYGKEGGTVHNE